MSPESSIHHCALAVKRQAQPAVGVLLRKVCFSVRTVPIHARTATGYRGGTGRTDVPRSGNRTEPTRRESRTYRIFHIESPRYAIHVDDGVDRTTTYANAPTSVAKRDRWRHQVQSAPPLGRVAALCRRIPGWSWRPRRRVPSRFGFRRSYSHGALPAQYS